MSDLTRRGFLTSAAAVTATVLPSPVGQVALNYDDAFKVRLSDLSPTDGNGSGSVYR
jgi:hypothetical protein